MEAPRLQDSELPAKRNAIIARNEREINANYAAVQETSATESEAAAKVGHFPPSLPPPPLPVVWAVTLRNKLNMGVNFVDSLCFVYRNIQGSGIYRQWRTMAFGKGQTWPEEGQRLLNNTQRTQRSPSLTFPFATLVDVKENRATRTHAKFHLLAAGS